MRSVIAAAALAVLAGCMPKKVVEVPLPARGFPPIPKAAPRAAAKPAEPRDVRRAWGPTGSFARGRFEGEMRKLRDGRALLVGGLVGTAHGLPDVDLFDPGTGNWTSRAPLYQGRYEFAAEPLADGRLLVSGGIGPDGTVLRTVEIYDSEADAWKQAAPMAQVREGHQLALLPDGRILAAGGYDGHEMLRSAEIYDPSRDAWSDAGTMSDPRFFAMMKVLSNGKVLIAGGSRFSSCDLYDPGRNSWTPTGSMSASRYLPGGATLPDGRVLVTGGGAGDVDAVRDTAEIYDPATGRWTLTSPMGTRRYMHAMVLTGGVPLVIGGANHETALSSTEYYDAETGSWRPGPPLGTMRSNPHAVVLDDGRVLTAGGRRGLLHAPALASAELLGTAGSLVQPFFAAEARPAAARVRPPAEAFDDPESPEWLPVAVAPRPHAHAIVIGIERYRQNLPSADFASGDARLTAEYFRRVLGVPARNLAFLGDDLATKSDFEKYFERWLPNRVEKGDEVYVYFSGHGAPDARTGEAYLVPYDADPTYIEQTGYPLKRLYEHLSRLPAKRVTVVLDSCFSGAGGRSVLADGARPLVSVAHRETPRGIIVLSASAGDQISNGYREKRHGLFTYFFLKGLKEKRGDFRAAFDYLRPEVARVARRELNADQEPQWNGGK